jgi:hypothetical protein
MRRWVTMFHKEMEFERAFVNAGGRLLAGIDPIAGVIPGFGDQREVELLVEAGFTPLEAIKIATLNGAQFLKEDDHIGSLTVGKQADIVIVNGDPSANIQDIEKVEIVFKDGVGYDSPKLIESVKGLVGTRQSELRIIIFAVHERNRCGEMSTWAPVDIPVRVHFSKHLPTSWY